MHGAVADALVSLAVLRRQTINTGGTKKKCFTKHNSGVLLFYYYYYCHYYHCHQNILALLCDC
jgi:hypothetical protein